MEQMKNWSIEVKARGFPYRFDDLAQFKRFSNDLLEGVQRASLPIDDVRVQGSALRKPTANDVDIAIFVDSSVFNDLLVNRFDMRITHGDAKVSLAGKSNAELVHLAADIEKSPGSYNAQGSSFQNAIKTGIINSKSDIISTLRQSLSLPGAGRFDLLPDCR